MLFFLLLTATLVTGIDIAGAPASTNCDSEIPNLHGTYLDKDNVRWHLTQVNDLVTLRTTTSGIQRVATGSLTQTRSNCKWQSTIAFSPENAQYKLSFEGREFNMTLVFTQGKTRFVFTQLNSGPKLRGRWLDKAKTDFRCKQVYSFLQCWNQNGDEVEGVLQRQGLQEKWNAMMSWVGADKNASMYVEKDEDGIGKQMVWPKDIWDRRNCKKGEKEEWECVKTVPKVAGTYYGGSDGQWEVTQKGKTITLIKSKNGKTGRGELKQKPNRCYWEAECYVLDKKGNPTTEKAYTVTVRPSGLYYENGTVLKPQKLLIEEEADDAKLTVN